MSKPNRKKRHRTPPAKLGATIVECNAALRNPGEGKSQIEAPTTDPKDATSVDKTKFEITDWLNYYSQVREFQAAVATKFVNMLTKISAFTAAVMAGLGALLDKVNRDKSALFIIAACASIPILMSWIFLYAYRHQVKGAGEIMADIELKKLKIDKNLGLINKLRNSPYGFYSKFRASLVTHGTPPALVTLLLASAYIFSNLEPSIKHENPSQKFSVKANESQANHEQLSDDQDQKVFRQPTGEEETMTPTDN
jgi:hypothetical protein